MCMSTRSSFICFSDTPKASANSGIEIPWCSNKYGTKSRARAVLSSADSLISALHSEDPIKRSLILLVQQSEHLRHAKSIRVKT